MHKTLDAIFNNICHEAGVPTRWDNVVMEKTAMSLDVELLLCNAFDVLMSPGYMAAEDADGESKPWAKHNFALVERRGLPYAVTATVLCFITHLCQVAPKTLSLDCVPTVVQLLCHIEAEQHSPKGEVAVATLRCVLRQVDSSFLGVTTVIACEGIWGWLVANLSTPVPVLRKAMLSLADKALRDGAQAHLSSTFTLASCMEVIDRHFAEDESLPHKQIVLGSLRNRVAAALGPPSSSTVPPSYFLDPAALATLLRDAHHELRSRLGDMEACVDHLELSYSTVTSSHNATTPTFQNRGTLAHFASWQIN